MAGVEGHAGPLMLHGSGVGGGGGAQYVLRAEKVEDGVRAALVQADAKRLRAADPGGAPHDPLGGHAPLLLLLLPAANLRSVRGLPPSPPSRPPRLPPVNTALGFIEAAIFGPRVWGAPARSAAREGSREPSAEAPGARTAPGMNATALMFYFNARLRPSPRVFE